MYQITFNDIVAILQSSSIKLSDANSRPPLPIHFEVMVSNDYMSPYGPPMHFMPTALHSVRLGGI